LYVYKVIFAPLAGLEMRVTQIFLLFFRNSFFFVYRHSDSPRVNALGYLLVRQTTTLSQHPPAEAETASHTPRKINDL